jgi:hypothetical protein
VLDCDPVRVSTVAQCVDASRNDLIRPQDDAVSVAGDADHGASLAAISRRRGDQLQPLDPHTVGVIDLDEREVGRSS